MDKWEGDKGINLGRQEAAALHARAIMSQEEAYSFTLIEQGSRGASRQEQQ